MVTDTLVLKLVLTPILIAVASLAGRRWGPGVSGWLVGLPFTSGPVALFLTLNQGAVFAAGAAAGSLAGAIAQAAFCLAFAWLALRSAWLLALSAGCLAFGAATLALQRVTLPPVPLFVAVIGALAAAIRLMPRTAWAAPAASAPRWDIPARMALAVALVLLITGVAPTLGPRLSGLLATFPLYAALLAVFACRLQGADAATRVLRGLLIGLFAFAGFFLVLAVLLDHASIAAAYAAAIAVALALQAGSLRAVRPAA